MAGRKVAVPAYVGFGVGSDDRVHFLATIHTHDGSGVIHVESPTRQTFTLGELFDVWGVRLTPSCLGGYCAKGRSRLWTFSDGRPVSGDPRSVVLKAHEEIVVAYGTKAQLPRPVPAKFAFPQGF